jgi:trypsin
MKAQVKLVNATGGFSGGFNLHLSSDNGQTHQGGLCFGDSGGPVLLGSTVYAVNSFAINGNCAGSGYSFRVDLPAINAWIRSQ